MKLKEIIPIYISYKENYVKRSSMSQYMSLLETHIIPEFSEVEKLEEYLIQDFVLKKLKFGLSQKTIKMNLILLKNIMKFAAKRNIMEFVAWDIEYPKQDKQTNIEVFSLSEHKKIISHVKDNLSFRNLGILIVISTGLRIGEICALQWSDIDVQNGIITVNKTIQRIYVRHGDHGKRCTEVLIDTPKTKSSQRQIPLSSDLLSILKPLIKVLNKDYYVLTNEANPLEPRNYREYYGKLLLSLNMPKLCFHSLRHTFATRCVNSKIDIKTISVILGHSDVSTTLNTYTHPNLEQKRSAMNELFKALR